MANQLGSKYVDTFTLKFVSVVISSSLVCLRLYLDFSLSTSVFGRLLPFNYFH